MRARTRIVGLILLVAVAGCTMQAEPQADTARPTLAARLVEAQQSQAAALALWDRIIFGEIVSCQEAIPAPLPLALTGYEVRRHPQAEEIERLLNQAIQAIRDSSDVWNLECAEKREIVPLDVAQQGRQSALAATDPLAQASALLDQWPAE
jgi:hypothetical protein